MFESARSKVRRAKKHIGDLIVLFERFVDRQPYTVAIKADGKGGTEVRIRLTEPMPVELGLTIGDAIHNLRCALDHATWELIGLDKGTQNRHTKLPTGKDRIDYEASARGMITPRQDTKDFFVDLGIFPRGPGASIYELHLLNNADKHTVITPTLAAGRLTSARAVNDAGAVILDMTDVTLDIREDGVGRFMNFSQGVTLELDNNSKVLPEIFLRQSTGISPAFPTLSMFLKDVSVMLDAFEAFASGRAP
jgi:hypothetical protein